MKTNFGNTFVPNTDHCETFAKCTGGDYELKYCTTGEAPESTYWMGPVFGTLGFIFFVCCCCCLNAAKIKQYNGHTKAMRKGITNRNSSNRSSRQSTNSNLRSTNRTQPHQTLSNPEDIQLNSTVIAVAEVHHFDASAPPTYNLAEAPIATAYVLGDHNNQYGGGKS